jgi:hypothetical protein
MGSYANFWQVTGDALALTAKLLDLDFTQEKHDRLMEAFLRLKAWSLNEAHGHLGAAD